MQLFLSFRISYINYYFFIIFYLPIISLLQAQFLLIIPKFSNINFFPRNQGNDSNINYMDAELNIVECNRRRLLKLINRFVKCGNCSSLTKHMKLCSAGHIICSNAGCDSETCQKCNSRWAMKNFRLPLDLRKARKLVRKKTKKLIDHNVLNRELECPICKKTLSWLVRTCPLCSANFCQECTYHQESIGHTSAVCCAMCNLPMFLVNNLFMEFLMRKIWRKQYYGILPQEMAVNTIVVPQSRCLKRHPLNLGEYNLQPMILPVYIEGTGLFLINIYTKTVEPTVIMCSLWTTVIPAVPGNYEFKLKLWNEELGEHTIEKWCVEGTDSIEVKDETELFQWLYSGKIIQLYHFTVERVHQEVKQLPVLPPEYYI